MKDTNNLLTHSQWSSGEYSNPTNIATGLGQKYQISNKFSSIGENSIKITRIGDEKTWTEARTYNVSKNTFTISCDVLAKCSGRLYFVAIYTDNTQDFSFTEFNVKDDVQHITTVGTINQSKTISFVSIRVMVERVGGFVYADNFSIT